jgi:hypothetical protein
MSLVKALREWLSDNQPLMAAHQFDILLHESLEQKSFSVSLRFGEVAVAYGVWDRSPSGADMIVQSLKGRTALVVIERVDPAHEIVLADLQEMLWKLLSGEYDRMHVDKTHFIRK